MGNRINGKPLLQKAGRGQINDSKLQPKYCGCEGGSPKSELAPLEGAFQQYFCA
jgi:hypothetical protein